MKLAFETAIAYLKQGYKIRRSGWEKGCYIYLDGASIHFHYPNGRVTSQGCFWVYEALAEDWELEGNGKEMEINGKEME